MASTFELTELVGGDVQWKPGDPTQIQLHTRWRVVANDGRAPFIAPAVTEPTSWPGPLVQADWDDAYNEAGTTAVAMLGGTFSLVGANPVILP